MGSASDLASAAPMSRPIGAVQRWFVRRRGFASGLAVSGIGVGTLVMPPLASLLIEMLGWRGAYLVLGALAAVVGGGMALLIENDPRDRGPRSRRRSAAAGRAIGTAGRRLGQRGDPLAALHRSVCRLPDLLVRRVRAVRASRALRAGSRRRASSAVLLLGVIGVGSTAGRFFLGGLADRMGRQSSLLLMFVGMALALVDLG